MAPRRDDEDGKGFLTRWSERKRAAESEAAGPEPAAPARDDSEAAAEEVIDPKDLPDIDSLEPGADFSVFMKKGVPPALKRKALNKLWQTDPAFRHICMLDDYNLDYTDAAMVVPNLKTLFQVGRGMVLPEDELPEDQLAAAGEATAEGADVGQEPAAPVLASEPAGSAAPLGDSAPGTTAAPARRVHLPGTPRVTPPAKKAPAARASATGRGERSARQRRWGDPDAE